MQLTKLNIILIAILLLQTIGIVTLANRIPGVDKMQATQQLPDVKFDKKLSAQSLARFNEVAEKAVKQGVWTESDGKALKKEYDRMSNDDKRKALDKIADAVSKQTFKPGEKVVLPFDYL